MSACATCGKCPCYEHERRTVMADPKGKHHGHGNLYCNGNVTAETCWTIGPCETHGDATGLHLTGYTVCECGFRCLTSDQAALRRHQSGLS